MNKIKILETIKALILHEMPKSYVENYENSYRSIIANRENNIIQNINRLDKYPSITPPYRKKEMVDAFYRLAMFYKASVLTDPNKMITVEDLQKCLDGEKKFLIKKDMPKTIILNKEMNIYLDDDYLIINIDCSNKKNNINYNKLRGKTLTELRNKLIRLGRVEYIKDLDSAITYFNQQQERTEYILNGIICELLKMDKLSESAPFAYSFARMFNVDTTAPIICTDPHSSSLMNLANSYHQNGGRDTVIVYTPDKTGNFNRPMYLKDAMERGHQYMNKKKISKQY